MVDVGAKPETLREAVATAAVKMSRATLALVRRSGGAKGKGDVVAGARLGGPLAGKGDVVAVARLAGLMAVKRASDLIPLCHPVRVVGSDVDLTFDAALPGVRV